MYKFLIYISINSLSIVCKLTTVSLHTTLLQSMMLRKLQLGHVLLQRIHIKKIQSMDMYRKTIISQRGSKYYYFFINSDTNNLHNIETSLSRIIRADRLRKLFQQIWVQRYFLEIHFNFHYFQIIYFYIFDTYYKNSLRKFQEQPFSHYQRQTFSFEADKLIKIILNLLKFSCVAFNSKRNRRKCVVCSKIILALSIILAIFVQFDSHFKLIHTC